MEPEVQPSLPKRSKKNVIIIVLLAFITTMLLSASVLSYFVLQSTGTYKGVHIGKLDVSGMGRQDMLQYLESQYTAPSAQLKITLKTPSTELQATYPELGVDYDIEAAAEAAYSVGRTGNVFMRLYDILRAGISGTEINMPQICEDGKVDNFVNEFCTKAFKEVKEGALLITDERVMIRSGKHGESVDKKAVRALVTDMITSNKAGVIEPEVIMTYPAVFDTDDIYAQLICEPVDASFAIENGSVKVVPHMTGKRIEKSELEDIIEELNKTEDTGRQLPVILTNPEITTEIATSMLFRDELANVSTKYKTTTQNEKNREHNIGLAVSKFNGTILLPGEEFSFNKIVGSRNETTGYKEAHVYINGRVEDGIGGGICQSVSTLYTAVLKADLNVTERKSHSFIVTYVPLGQDATAYYGGTDFRFVNSTQWPMKIEAWLFKNRVHVVFKGTNTTPDKKVFISSKVMSQTPHETKYVDDPTLPVGTTKKEQYGTDGFIVDTYKTIKSGNVVVSQTKLHTSRYKPCTEEIHVGILKPDGTTTPGLAEEMRKKNTPAVPGTPKTQEKPTTPAAPVTPAVPGDAEAQPQPTIPSTPEGEETPETPVVPETPETPVTPPGADSPPTAQ